MEKQLFQAESQRLMDLMINSIYTHKEIFLRELISNASDAEDKLAYRALTDDSVTLSREDLKITLIPNKDARTLTLIDNGVGMTLEEVQNNLGTIAKSGSLQFKKEMNREGVSTEDVDVIGQFGVGFYSAFMVSDEVIVRTRSYDSSEGFEWKSTGADGYTVESCEKDTYGTEIVMHIKEDNEDETYSEYLEVNKLRGLIKKYSDYIRYPITMEVEDYRMKAPEETGEETEDNKQPQWETIVEWQTINSMVPLWQRRKAEVTEEEYNQFYQEKFMDWQNPIATLHTNVEGQVTYKALLYVPSHTPHDFYTREYQKGLQLYSSGVLIMDKCGDLLPEHFRFVNGVVDSQDFSLNISREMLQHTRQLKIIASNLEKKIKGELVKLMKDDREKYEQFWTAFGMQLKYGVASEYGQHKDILKDLLLFWSSKEAKYITLDEYKERMPEDQPYYYYACGESVEKIARLPQVERILDMGYEIFYCTEDVDDFVMKALKDIDGKTLKSVTDEDAIPQTDEQKQESEQKTEANRPMLDAVQEALGETVHAVRLSNMLKNSAVCLSAEGPVSLEMEKYMRKVEGAGEAKAQRVLELNGDATPVIALQLAVAAGDTEKVSQYSKLLYGQALLLADLPLENPAEYATLVCELMK